MNTDQNHTKPKQKNRQWLGVLLFVLIGVFCGIVMMMFIDHAEANGASVPVRLLYFLLLLLVMYAVILVQIVIHEGGHLLFGLMTGYRFSSFRIASLMLVKEGNRFQFKKLSLAGTGGQCLMCPPDLHNGTMPFVLYNFGGAILNAAAGAAGLILCFHFPVYSAGWVVSSYVAVIGFAFALINGLPVRMGTVNNDGRNALDMLESREAVRAFWLQLKVTEEIARGKRLKDMPEEWFAVPSDESMKNGIIAVTGVYACNRLMDQHRFAEADALMARLLMQENGIVGLHRGLLVCDRMFIELIGENRPEVLHAMRTAEQMKLMKSMKTSPSVLRTEYAYALLGENDPGKADGILGQFEKCSASYPYPCEVEAERELLEIARGVFSERQGG